MFEVLLYRLVIGVWLLDLIESRLGGIGIWLLEFFDGGHERP